MEIDEEAQVTICFWHAMSGDRIDLIQGIAVKYGILIGMALNMGLPVRKSPAEDDGATWWP